MCLKSLLVQNLPGGAGMWFAVRVRKVAFIGTREESGTNVYKNSFKISI